MTCKDCYHCSVCCGHDEEKANREYPSVEKCRDYKDKSRIVELPCKVGDTIYDIYDAKYNGGNNIRELKVPEIHINLDRRNKPWIIISSYYFAFEDFGKTVFLTREEAEEVLRKEREK